MIPSVNGMSVRPASVGDWPLTICRYSGSVARPPNMPRPITVLAAAPTENVRFRKSESGRIASALAYRSASRNAATPSTPTA